MAEGFNPKGIWGPRGRGFSMGAVQRDGYVIHFTGQVAWDENERIVGKGDIEAQTRQCFKNILAVLLSVGGVMEDVVAITTYFTDRAQLPAIQRVSTEFIKEEAAPVSTSVMVAGLGHEDFLVELTPVAVVPKERFVRPGEPLARA